MLILIACLLLFVTAFALLALRATRPNARYAWLAAVGGAALALVSVFFWLGWMPFDLVMPAWKPQTLFPDSVLFRADGVSWALALGIASLTFSILLTAAARPVVGNPLSWTGTLILGGLGTLAVTASNPLTLLLMWAFLDLTELVAQLSSVNGEKNSERAVISFATRAAGIGVVLWAYIESMSGGSGFDFRSIPPGAGAYLVIAAGLRLGVLPLHLPYDSSSVLRRGFGTALRLIGAISTLGMLGRATIAAGPLTPILTVLSAIAALYGGWMWLRAPDELNGRPYWMIGIASLALLAALGGNRVGAAAWSGALILTGGALFLASVRNVRLGRALLVGAWSLSSLPFSLTAGARLGSLGFSAPFAIAAQAFLMAGFIRHAMRPGESEPFDDQPPWAKTAYPAGIILLLVVQVLLGFLGWDGARQIGDWISALAASLLTLGLVWASRRFRIFSPARAHWVNAAGSRVNSLYEWLWSFYRGAARLGKTMTDALEGEGGIMWTLLFLVVFISIIARGI